MTEAEKIQVAAGLIADEMYKRCGRTPSSADCLAIARQLHRIWEQRVPIADLKPGDVAQRMRERYER